jgi:hypothetical protein
MFLNIFYLFTFISLSRRLRKKAVSAVHGHCFRDIVGKFLKISQENP